jgi:hypothetical protein
MRYCGRYKEHDQQTFRTSWMRSNARIWSSVSSVGDSPPCRQKTCKDVCLAGDAYLNAIQLHSVRDLDFVSHLVLNHARQRQIVEKVREVSPHLLAS